MYSNGASEVVVGKALKKYEIPRESVVIMTKVFMVVHDTPEGPKGAKMTGGPPSGGKPNQSGLSRKVS